MLSAQQFLNLRPEPQEQNEFLEAIMERTTGIVFSCAMK
jgi:hypothetical protein